MSKNDGLSFKGKDLFYISLIIALVVGFVVGYYFGGSSMMFSCHVDKVDVDELYSLLSDNGVGGNGGSLRFFNKNSTLEYVYNTYDRFYPMSKGVLEVELTRLCK